MFALLLFITGASLVLWGVSTFSIPATAILGGLTLIWIAAQDRTGGAANE